MPHAFDWDRVPKQALIDAMRNSNLGPSSLSRQSKADLVSLAEKAIRDLSFPRAEALKDDIARETTFRRTGRAL
jgi:hypothetical protein